MTARARLCLTSIGLDPGDVPIDEPTAEDYLALLMFLRDWRVLVCAREIGERRAGYVQVVQ